MCVSHVLEKMRKDGTGGPEWTGEPRPIRPRSHAHQSTVLKKIHNSRRMLCEGSTSVTPFDFIACGQSNERKGDSMYPKTFCKMTHPMDAEAASPLIVGQIV